VTEPLLRKAGKLEAAAWDEALQAVADRIGQTKAHSIGLLSTSNSTNEALYMAGKLFRKELKATNCALMNKAVSKLFGNQKGSFADIADGDLILVVGVNPAADQPVAAYLVKRAVDKGARLIVVDQAANGLTPFAYMSMDLSDIDKAVAMAQRAERPVVMYGAAITEQAISSLKQISKKASFIHLEPGVNTYAAMTFGLDGVLDASKVKLLYVLLGEQNWRADAMLTNLGEDAFCVVQTSFISPIMQKADVVLPMAIWSERSGSLTNSEGRVQMTTQAVEAAGAAKPDWEILASLAGKLGKKLGSALDEISAQAIKEIIGKEYR
jgi:NADH-quinone oxidoreductase subunit G